MPQVAVFDQIPEVPIHRETDLVPISAARVRQFLVADKATFLRSLPNNRQRAIEV